MTRVLVVDDQRSVRWVVARMLRSRGVETVEAGDGTEALAALHDGGAAFDLVLTDLRMPEMGGVELACAVRVEDPALPVVAMLGWSGGYTMPELEQAFDAILLKPFRPEILFDALHGAMPDGDETFLQR